MYESRIAGIIRGIRLFSLVGCGSPAKPGSHILRGLRRLVAALMKWLYLGTQGTLWSNFPGSCRFLQRNWLLQPGSLSNGSLNNLEIRASAFKCSPAEFFGATTSTRRRDARGLLSMELKSIPLLLLPKLATS